MITVSYRHAWEVITLSGVFGAKFKMNTFVVKFSKVIKIYNFLIIIFEILYWISWGIGNVILE